jgi:hypothetical protein
MMPYWSLDHARAASHRHVPAGILSGPDHRYRGRRDVSRNSEPVQALGRHRRQAGTLLDLPVRSYRRWKAGDIGRIDRDQKARLSNLMGIHKALRIIFREPRRGYDWIGKPNAAFAGRSALDVLLGGELTDLMRVRRYLDAERGGW